MLMSPLIVVVLLKGTSWTCSLQMTGVGSGLRLARESPFHCKSQECSVLWISCCESFGIVWILRHIGPLLTSKAERSLAFYLPEGHSNNDRKSSLGKACWDLMGPAPQQGLLQVQGFATCHSVEPPVSLQMHSLHDSQGYSVALLCNHKRDQNSPFQLANIPKGQRMCCGL